MTSASTLRTAIYVINLSTSLDRRHAFERQVAASGTELAWSYHEAHRVLSPSLRYDPDDAIIAKGRELYPAELGIYSSHYSVWQRMLDEQADQALILEDDVVIDWDFVATLADCDLHRMGVNYLKLFNKNITPYRVVCEHFHRRTLIDCRGFAHGAQAYLVTRQGAETFLALCQEVCRPIDDELDRSWAHGIPNVAVFPFPAFERHVPSTAGSARYAKHSVPLRYQGRRLKLRLQEKARRAWQKVGGYGHQPVFNDAD